MLDPEGDKNPTLPGDGGPPPLSHAFAMDTAALRCVSTSYLVRHLADAISVVSERFKPRTEAERALAMKSGTPQALVREAIGQLYDAAALSLRFPEDARQRDKVTIALEAARVIVDGMWPECPLCNDVGVVGSGEPCPTGCAASLAATQYDKLTADLIDVDPGSIQQNASN